MPDRSPLSARITAFPAALLPLPAAAEAIVEGPGGQLAAGAIVIGVMLVFLFGAWLLLRHLARDLAAVPGAAGGATARLLDLPLGVPEGSVRALLSVFIIVFGFLLLAFAGPLGLRAGEALTGFIGAVISFYFASRAGERSAGTAREAAAAVSRAADALQSAGAAPPPPPRDATLRDAGSRLQALHAVLSATAELAVGTGAVPGAAAALERVDALLGRLDPVLAGGADAGAVGPLAEEAAALLREFGELGPVGTALGDALSTIGAVAAESAPVARGLATLTGGALAGPAGLVAAVAIGGLELVRDRERFGRWKAAMLDTPLDLGLLPPVVDAGLAAAALLRTPALASHLAPGGVVEPALALSVWEALGIGAEGAPRPARSAAAQVLDGAGPSELRTIFLGQPEALAEAAEELRAAMTGAAALAGLGLPAVTVAGAEVPTASLTDAVQTLRQDGRAAAEIERIVYLVEALGGSAPATLSRIAARLGTPEFWRGLGAA